MLEQSSSVVSLAGDQVTPTFLCQSLACLYWQLGGFPACNPAGNFADARKSATLQQAGGDGGAVSAGAVVQQRAISWEIFQMLGQVVERDAQAAGDVLLVALTRGANVDGER